MSYDPKLKECMARIEKLCEEYDVGGSVSLISREGGEFRYVLPKWTAFIEEVTADGIERIRLRCKKEEREKAQLTAHFIHSGRDTAALFFKFFDEFVRATDAKWQTEHTAFHKFRAHRKDEN